ncbi:sulfite exporter TauE/SafE family protein [Hwanghaeella sp.]|uniref:sulfite exporter TauE/SafE family protein n=1 Tax=Hwanghaeella sp. TaxID=2605943 RepID=UPI003CCB8DE1
MPDPMIIALIAATFLLAGMVKGVIGLGLPTVSLAVLTAVLDLPTAMALLLVPSFATNLWQASLGGNAGILLRRLWPFLLTATATIWIGAVGLAHFDLSVSSALLGLLLIVYAGTSLAGFRLSVRAAQEAWFSPLFGSINGILTGMTGSFVVPGVMYLQAIGLPRDQLIQAMGMLFTLSTIGLGLALQGNDMLNADLGLQSGIALAPALLGMSLGQRIRKRLSETVFRRVFFAALLALGSFIIARAF